MADALPHFTAADALRFGIGLVGAFVSLKFLKDTTKTEKALLVLGGSILSYEGTPAAVAYLKLGSADGLVGFMLGLFGMALVTKLYEAIQLVDMKRVVEWAQDRFFTKKG